MARAIDSVVVQAVDKYNLTSYIHLAGFVHEHIARNVELFQVICRALLELEEV